KIRHEKRSVNNNLKDQCDNSSAPSIAPQVCLPSMIRPAQTRLGPTGVAVWFLFSTFCVFKAFTLFRTSPLFSCASLTSWASKDVVWSNMLEKDKAYTRDVHMMEKHPHLQPKMRAILLDWLMEVSEVYKLHRETYHLAQDYFDRFMATQRNVFKSTLQLIGITCLFIAAKVEEMYPPKVHQFAYVTDEACTEDEILSMEIIIMMLLDLCLLDVRCLEFSNGVLAASALFHFSSLELVEAVSGRNGNALEECVRWMVPFAMALREVSGASLKSFPGIPEDDVHNIQIHASYMAWLVSSVLQQNFMHRAHRSIYRIFQTISRTFFHSLSGGVTCTPQRLIIPEFHKFVIFTLITTRGRSRRVYLRNEFL
uniref:G2/mitotic-specific cyclin-B2 n=1 Tax=Takifugu rubripes TaxID=31033 RepID=A0A3B5KA48_TAKRU